METGSLFGLKVHKLTMDQALQEIDSLVRGGGAHLVVTLGVEMVMRAEKDPEFFQAVNGASLVIPDSVGILWACRKTGFPLPERLPGIDVLTRAARQAEKYPWRVFFLGAKPGTAEEAARRMKEEYPAFNVAGFHHGYFQDDGPVIDRIREAGTQVLFIAMGSPAQEKWFLKNRDRLGNVVAIGVGGSLDVLSGSVKRAPAFFRNLGLEWLHRLISEPSRMGRMAALPAFVIKVLIKGA
jgi:N-acetylglucosaminyldiphosphoundecaprenol N-acetyl-beta-D-mannosaminyltransferase